MASQLTNCGPAQVPVTRIAHWARRLAPAGVYVGVRLVGVAILAIVGAVNGRQLVPTLHSWDGDWYLRIAATGYSPLSAGVDANGHVAANTTLVFFPGYPALISVVAALTRLDTVTAGLLISFVAGLIACYGIMRLCARLDVPQWTGLICVALFASTPMSVTLSMAYTEALFTALVYGQTLLDPDQFQTLLIFTAVPGTESHEKLELLSAIGHRPPAAVTASAESLYPRVFEFVVGPFYVVGSAPVLVGEPGPE